MHGLWRCSELEFSCKVFLTKSTCLKEKWELKTVHRITALDWHPHKDEDIIQAGDSVRNILFWQALGKVTFKGRSIPLLRERNIIC